jgi:hypothetical protein
MSFGTKRSRIWPQMGFIAAVPSPDILCFWNPRAARAHPASGARRSSHFFRSLSVACLSLGAVRRLRIGLDALTGRLRANHDTRPLQAYLGHKNIQHTVRYSEMSPTWFSESPIPPYKDFSRD